MTELLGQCGAKLAIPLHVDFILAFEPRLSSLILPSSSYASIHVPRLRPQYLYLPLSRPSKIPPAASLHSIFIVIPWSLAKAPRPIARPSGPSPPGSPTATFASQSAPSASHTLLKSPLYPPLPASAASSRHPNCPLVTSSSASPLPSSSPRRPRASPP